MNDDAFLVAGGNSKMIMATLLLVRLSLAWFRWSCGIDPLLRVEDLVESCQVLQACP